jgi:hypothetical protein
VLVGYCLVTHVAKRAYLRRYGTWL